MTPCSPTAVNAPPAASQSTWTTFWFGDATASRVLPGVRVAVSLLAIWYLLSQWSDAARWFAGDGLLSATQLATFLNDGELGDQVRWRLSPLFWVDSPLGLHIYLLVGVLWAVLTLVGPATRLPAIALWLWVVGWANRALLVTGLEELLLVWALAYLAIAPPQPLRGCWRASRAGSAVPRLPEHWSGSLAKRMLQVHFTIMIAATALSMLSSLAWWDGTGVMALVAPTEIRSIDWTSVLSRPGVHELLTHLIVGVALVLPILLWNRRTQPWAVGLGWVWCVGLAAMSSQWLYFFGLAAVLLTFLPEKWLLAWNRCPVTVKVDHD